MNEAIGILKSHSPQARFRPTDVMRVTRYDGRTYAKYLYNGSAERSDRVGQQVWWGSEKDWKRRSREQDLRCDVQNKDTKYTLVATT